MVGCEKIAEEVIKGDSSAVASLVNEALAVNCPAEDILNQGLVRGMTEVGELFKNNDIFIPEVLVSAKAMKGGMEILKPHLAESNIESLGKAVVGTVQGDLHDIGKNIVAMLMEGAGFEVIDLGADVPIEKFVRAVKSENADLVGMSALLVTTMINMEDVIKGLKSEGLDHVKVMVGGAPLTQEYADKIGAHGYAADAASGIDVARRLLAK